MSSLKCTHITLAETVVYEYTHTHTHTFTSLLQNTLEYFSKHWSMIVNTYAIYENESFSSYF